MCLGAVKKSHQRRRLFSEASAAALTELRHYSSNTLILPSDNEQCFLCLRCFRLLQKSAKLRKDLQDLQNNVSKILEAAASLGATAHSAGNCRVSIFITGLWKNIMLYM